MKPLKTIERTLAAFQAASDVGSIRNDDHYNRMLELADSLVDGGQAVDGAQLEGLFAFVCELIRAYDEKRFRLPRGSARRVLAYLMDQHSLRQSGLPEIGNQSVVSQILSGRRELNVRQVAALARPFKLPADVFIDPRSSSASTH